MPDLVQVFAHGAATDRPSASAANEGFFYFSEDTGDFAQVQDGAWVTVAAAGGGGSGVQVAVAHATSTQLRNAQLPDGTDIVLVAAQGANTVVVPFLFFSFPLPGNTPYSDPNTTSFSVVWGPGGTLNADVLSGPVAALLGLYGDDTAFLAPLLASQSPLRTATVNQPLTLRFIDAITTGNGECLFVTHYSVLTVPT